MKRHQIITTILLLLFPICCLFANEISVTLSDRKVGLNDTFSATFSTSERIKSAPDFSVLETNFTIISQNQDQSVSIINGAISAEFRWKLVLMPKREGNLEIPSIHFGNHLTPAQEVVVKKATASKKEDQVFIEVDLSPQDNVYNQALLIGTVRLYYSAKLAQATLSDLTVSDQDALIQRIGKELEYDVDHDNGKRYRVHERRYAIIPQHEGEIVVAQVTFEGSIVTGGRSMFDMQTAFKRAHSKEKKIEVRKIPPPFTKSNWLAAIDVKLSEEWSSDPESIALGEPITWTLNIEADGCLGDQIPDLALDLPRDLKSYLDKPEITNIETPESCIGKKQIKVALIPSKSGQITIPKVHLAWWNVDTDQAVFSELPERQIRVLADPVAMNTPIPAAMEQNEPVLLAEESTQEVLSLQPIWRLSLLGSAFFLMIAAAFAIYKKCTFISPAKIAFKKVEKSLKKACRNNDAKSAEACLLAFTKLAFPDQKLHNLIQLKQEVSKELQEAIAELYQALYGKGSLWNGNHFWRVFRKFKPGKKNCRSIVKSTPLLRDLYPTEEQR